MRIKTRSIPSEGGLDVDYEIPPSVMRKAVAHGDDVTEVFQDPVHCKMHLELAEKDVYLSGGTETKIRPVCARCGEAFELPLLVKTVLTCSPEAERRKGSDSYQESEEGLVFFSHGELDLDEIVREQMLLALPMRYLCKEDCQGLCTRCGANLNQGAHTCKVSAQQ